MPECVLVLGDSSEIECIAHDFRVINAGFDFKTFSQACIRFISPYHVVQLSSVAKWPMHNNTGLFERFLLVFSFAEHFLYSKHEQS